MKTSIRYAAVAALLSLPVEVVAQLRLPFSRQSVPNAPATQRRSFPVDIFSALGTYVVNATAGTPPQNLSFALTLSADESWVPDAQYCDNDTSSLSYGACTYGSYNHNESSTFVRPGTGSFSASYLDGSYAEGDRIRETIGFAGGESVSNLTMGLAHDASRWIGVMALGFNETYSDVPNLPDRMLALGLINSTAYSLWVDDEDSGTGHILFGAVEKGAFDGTLNRISADRNHYNPSNSYSYSNTFDVYIQAINGSLSGEAFAPVIQNTSALPLVSVDPTYALSVLPEDIATAVWALAGAKYDETWDQATIPCSYRDNITAQLVVQLDNTDNGPIIRVPVSDLVLSEDVWDWEDWDYDSDTSTKYCLFGVQTTNDTSYTYSSFEDNWIIGGGLLKRQYMVFDLANEEIAMAPVASGQTGEVVPFSIYGAKIPESSSAISKCYADDECYNSDSGSSSSSSSSGDDSNGLSKDVIGIIAGFSILGAVMLAIAIWGIVQCCRDNSKYGRPAVLAEKGPLLGNASPQGAQSGVSPPDGQSGV